MKPAIMDRAWRRESSLRAARFLAILVFAGAAVAALAGLLTEGRKGAPETALSSWGQEIRLDGRGVYRRDSFSGAAQERAQDLVTLVFALPLLATGWALSRRGGAGARLLLGGALGYFAYCYGMMAVATAYNGLFLLYVALFATSLWGLALALSSVDADELATRCAASFPRRSAVAVCLMVGAFLGLAWVGGRVLPALNRGRPPEGLEAYTTLAVQAFDLGILVPAALVSAFWLLRRDPRGFLLGSVLLVKGAAEGLAVSAMGLNMLRTGAAGAESLPMLAVFIGLAAAALAVGTRAVRSAGLRIPGSADASMARGEGR